eukprot:m.11701 g.11701  ORF g.11701 m.11701 type:complete len:159 (+) comp7491_c0_seq1:212-688(+)
MSSPSPASVLHAGYMHKRGKKVKSWKRRFMVLLGNGKLLYFVKPRPGWDTSPPSEWSPVDWDTIVPKGSLDVVVDIVDLLHWDKTRKEGLVTWEKTTAPYSGFSLEAKTGRLWSMYADSLEVRLAHLHTSLCTVRPLLSTSTTCGLACITVSRHPTGL